MVKKRLRRSKASRVGRFARDIVEHTPIINVLGLLLALWLTFSAGLYFAEARAPGSPIRTIGEALYWGVAAFSTAGIADTPTSDMGRLVGGLWIVIGSTIFFGAIVATVTTYFMRPLQRPHRRIIDTIEYNLEQLDALSEDELDLLRETVDSLIEHTEALRQRRTH